MKKIFQSFIIVMVLLIPACKNNVNVKAERRELLDTDNAWAEAAASGDISRISTFWTEDAINYYPGQEPAFDKEKILQIVKRNRSMPGFSLTWKVRDAVVSESGDIGYTHGSFKVTFNDPEGNSHIKSGNYVCIWKKQADGTWKCAVESSVPGPVPQQSEK